LSAIVIVGNQRAIATGAVQYSNKITSVEGCDYTFDMPAYAVLNETAIK